MAESPYSMVRLHWRYKPKVVDDKLYFKKWGRVSETTNRYLNLLISTRTGFETGVVITGNAGEHALTTKLADIMSYSTGYSVEPYHFIYLFEKCGLEVEEIAHQEAASAGIEIFQIETLNPHIHEEKGEVHVDDMLLSSLSTIYHCTLCNDYVRSKVLEELGDIMKLETPKKTVTMPSIREIDPHRFVRILEGTAESFARFEQGTIESEEEREEEREVEEKEVEET
jgi:mannosyl-3-phosphoglycerate synthase